MPHSAAEIGRRPRAKTCVRLAVNTTCSEAATLSWTCEQTWIPPTSMDKPAALFQCSHLAIPDGGWEPLQRHFSWSRELFRGGKT